MQENRHTHSPFEFFDREGLRLAAAAARCIGSMGIPFPLLLASWRVCFLVPLAYIVLYDLPGDPGSITAISWLLLASLVLVTSMSVPFIREFTRDASAEWDDRLWSKYATRALVYRELFFNLRILTAAFVTGILLSLAFIRPEAVPDEADLSTAWIIFLGLTLAIGGYLEACEPPKPGNGHFQGIPRHA